MDPLAPPSWEEPWIFFLKQVHFDHRGHPWTFLDHFDPFGQFSIIIIRMFILVRHCTCKSFDLSPKYNVALELHKLTLQFQVATCTHVVSMKSFGTQYYCKSVHIHLRLFAQLV